MGYRTVVVLYNDQAHEWENDPELGKKIARAMSYVNDRDRSDLHYGKVVECTHADTQTLAVLDGYSFTPVAYGMWQRLDKFDDIVQRLMKAAAEKLGFTLSKKRKTAEFSRSVVDVLPDL